MKFNESLESRRTSFLESLRVRSFSPATLKTLGQLLSTFFRFLTLHVIDDVREISSETIRAYQIWLLRQSYKSWTVVAHLQALRRFFEHLERTDAVLINPCAAIVLPKMPRKLPTNVLTHGEVSSVLDASDTQTGIGIRDKAILELFYSTGIRVGEMAGLSVHDVDARHSVVRINKGKFAKDRVVPMGKKARRYVQEYLARVRSQWTKTRRDERALWLASAAPFRPLARDGIM